MRMKCLCNIKCTINTIGSIFAFIGLILVIFGDNIFYAILSKEMTLKPGSRTFEQWKSPPIPINIDIYFFNWTNANDFRNRSTVPILKQLGPYRFTEKLDKVDIKWHSSNGTVSFRKKSTYFFDKNGSNGTLADNITTLNVVALSAAESSRYWNYLKQKSVSVGLQMYNQQITVNKNASELLFDGYQDDMIDIAREYPIFGEDITVPFDRFGWFYPRNNSADLMGDFNMFTGETDFNKIGQMNTWNFKKATGYFESHCGLVTGSAGEFYPPGRVVGDSISFFSPDLCRSVTFNYAETVEIEGIKGFKYVGDKQTVDNGTLYPENQCYCNGECVPSGVFNISACRFGTPVFMSFPHFYNADPYYLRQVKGIIPNKDLHEFYIVLEPATGIVLEVAARFQINMLVQPTPTVALYQNIPRIYLPLLWFEQKVRIHPDMAAELKPVVKIPKLQQTIGLIFIAISTILLLWIPVQNWIKKNNFNKSTKNTIQKEHERKIQTPEVSPLINKLDQMHNVVFIANTNEDNSVTTQLNTLN